MAIRRRAREAALQLLFQADLNPDASELVAQEMLRESVDKKSLRDFAWTLFTGTQKRRDELDQQIQRVAENWRVSRMPPTDRNILRMGIFEMTDVGTPPAVVIDECVELARAYGTEHSSQFVNGILDKLIPQTAAAPDDPAVSL